MSKSRLLLLCGALIAGAPALAVAQVGSVDTCFNYLSAQDYRRAQAAGEMLVKQNPANRNAHFCLGRALSYQGKHREALPVLLRVEQLSQSKAELAAAYSWLGTTYLNLGNSDNALNYYSRGLSLRRELGQKNEVAAELSNLGVLYGRQGNFAKAIEMLEASVSLADSLAVKTPIWNDLALAYDGQGDTQKAITFLQEALDADRQLGNATYAAMHQKNLGYMQMKAGDFDSAEANLKEALVALQKQGLQDWIGVTKTQLKDLQKARKAASQNATGR